MEKQYSYINMGVSNKKVFHSMILIENCRWFDCEHVFLVRIGKKKGAVILLFTIVTPVTPTDL